MREDTTCETVLKMCFCHKISKRAVYQIFWQIFWAWVFLKKELIFADFKRLPGAIILAFPVPSATKSDSRTEVLNIDLKELAVSKLVYMEYTDMQMWTGLMQIVSVG